jgi:hypothetical protein
MVVAPEVCSALNNVAKSSHTPLLPTLVKRSAIAAGSHFIGKSTNAVANHCPFNEWAVTAILPNNLGDNHVPGNP